MMAQALPLSWRAAAFAVLLAAALAFPAAAVVVDDFSTAQATLTDPAGGASSVATAGADIVGQHRDLVVDLESGAGPVSAGVAAGVLSVAVTGTTPDSRGQAVVTWDADFDPNALDETGLSPLDLTGGNHSSFAITVTAADAGAEILLEVYTDASHMSRAALRLPAVAASTVFYLSYEEDFVKRLGSGADFADVGAIVMTVRGTETSVTIDKVETVAPSLTVTKVDLTTGDVAIGTTKQTPGTTFKYRVTITNTGGEALAVDVADTIDANTTLSAATVDATPVAANDAYSTFGNVPLSVADTEGLLANDFDPDQNGAPPALVVTSVGAIATTLGGSATVAADGSFDYTPPIGVGKTVDTFAYTAQDNEGNSAAATATIHLGRVIWFVDDAHPGADLGTRDDPFVGFTGTNVGGAGGAGDQDAAGDVIFLYAGTQTAGIELEADQDLIGEGDGLTLDGETIVAAGTRPVITNAGGNGIELASDNTIHGLDVGNTSGVDIQGSSFGTLTVSNVALTGTGGALDLTTGTLAATFDSISSTNATGRGVNLDTVTGSLSVTGATSVTDSGAAGIRVTNGGSTYSFGTTTLTSTNSGIDLSSSATSTFNFTSLAVTTDAGPGLLASSSGTINIGGASNTIVATGGAALDVTSTSFGTGATFSTVSSSGSSGKGINLDGVTGNLTMSGGSITTSTDVAFDVNAGTGSISYGGTITNASNRAVEVTSRTTSTVTVSGNISDSGTGVNIASNSGGTVTLSGTYTGTAATSQIDVGSNSGTAVVNFSGSSKVLSTGASNAIDVTTNGTATVNFTGGGLSVTTTSGIGFNATGGAGGVNITGAGNSVTSTTGTAVNIASTTIGGSNVTFQSITSTTASANTAIVLANTGSGQFMVTGTGSAGSGGTISNKTVDAMTLSNTDGLVTLEGMIFEDIGDMGGTFNTISNDDAIHGEQVDGGMTLDGMTIRRISDNAIHGATLAGNANTVWNGLTITDSTIENTNRFHVAGVGDANNEGMVRILGIRGTVSITNSVLQDGGELIDFFVTGSSTLNMTATGNDFFRAYKEFTSGTTASVGGHCVDVTVQSDGNANVTIGDRVSAALGNDFLNCRLGSVRVGNDSGATGNIDAIIAKNNFTVDDHSSGFGGDFDFPQGGVLLISRGTDTATLDVVVDGNDFDEVTNASGGEGQLSFDMQNGIWQALVQNNTFDTPGDAPWFLRADSTASAKVLFQNNQGIKGAFCSTDPSAAGGGCDLGAGQLCPGAAGYCGPGLRALSDLQNNAVLDLTIIGDLFAEHDAGFDPGQTYEARVLPTGGGGTLCLDLQNNQAPDGYSLEEYAGDFNLVGSGTCPVGAPSANCQTLLGNRGNRGGSNVATTNPPYVNVEAGSTIDVVASACQQPSGGIF